MSNSGITFKVYLVDGDNSEVKRFFVDNDTVTSYIFMEEKLKSVFPSLRACDFRINWKDTDGDLISISNDEDFITALTEMNSNPKVLYVNTSSKNVPDAPSQFRVVCDICQAGIKGFRYKCIECPDYDLCATCEGNGHHSEHMMLRVPNNNTSIARLDRKMMHNAARALKKCATQVHKCARESFKTTEKEKHTRPDNAGTSTRTPSYGCPLSACDLNQLIAQNITPFFELLSKPAPALSSQNQGTPNKDLSNLIRSVIEAFTGSVITELESQTGSNSRNEESENGQNKENSNIPSSSQSQHSQPKSTSPTGQEMEWTMVGEYEDIAPQINAESKATNAQPAEPPQDPRMIRALAQLHEMGFSNENNLLNYLLKLHDYNIASVVKAILELK